VVVVLPIVLAFFWVIRYALEAAVVQGHPVVQVQTPHIAALHYILLAVVLVPVVKLGFQYVDNPFVVLVIAWLVNGLLSILLVIRVVAAI